MMSQQPTMSPQDAPAGGGGGRQPNGSPPPLANPKDQSNPDGYQNQAGGEQTQRLDDTADFSIEFYAGAPQTMQACGFYQAWIRFKSSEDRVRVTVAIRTERNKWITAGRRWRLRKGENIINIRVPALDRLVVGEKYIMKADIRRDSAPTFRDILAVSKSTEVFTAEPCEEA